MNPFETRKQQHADRIKFGKRLAAVLKTALVADIPSIRRQMKKLGFLITPEE